MNKLSKIIDHLIKINGDRYNTATRLYYFVIMIIIAIISGQILKQLWQM